MITEESSVREGRMTRKGKGKRRLVPEGMFRRVEAIDVGEEGYEESK